MTHPRHQLDPVIHNPARFSIMAMLVAADKVEFRFIRDTVGISDSSLSQHVTTLEKAGYVKVTKGQAGRRPRTWLAANPTGREAFQRHVDVLNQIVSFSASGEAERIEGEQPPEVRVPHA